MLCSNSNPQPAVYLCFVPLLVTQHSNRHPGKRGKLEARKLRIELRFVQAQRTPTRTRTSPQSLQPCGTYLLFTSLPLSSLTPLTTSTSDLFSLNRIGIGRLQILAFWDLLLVRSPSRRSTPCHCHGSTQARDGHCSRSTHTRRRNARDSLCRQCYLSRKCMAVSPTHPFPVVPGASTTPVEKHRFFD